MSTHAEDAECPTYCIACDGPMVISTADMGAEEWRAWNGEAPQGAQPSEVIYDY